MELPLGGPSLRHYTQSRPRPHRQKLNHRPRSRPQEPIIEIEDESLDLMGRVDEGVEEFFTKRVLPADVLKSEQESAPVPEALHPSAASAPPPTRTLRRKLGDFFTLRKRRGLKAEAGQEGRSKKASIADLIRPLREAARADKNKAKESEKENEKESEKENEKENEKERPGGDGVEEEEAPGPGSVALRSDAAPPRRALREGKSQSLILLSGSAAPGAGAGGGSSGARQNAKKSFDGQHSFEQKLSLMLQRIGVTKSPPAEEQNPEGEMKKADSEGTIIDNKPEPPPTSSKPRTMSTSSDTRHQIRQSASAHESAGKPALPPKPIIKPGLPQAPPSGRSTPENQLSEIQEADAACAPDPSAPSPSPCPPVSPLPEPSIPPSDPAASSPPAPAGALSTAAAAARPDVVELKSPLEAASPALVDKVAAVETDAASPTRPPSSSAFAVPTSATETLPPAPPPGAAAADPSSAPLLSVTTAAVPATSPASPPLPASPASSECITSPPLLPPATTTPSTSVTSSASAAPANASTRSPSGLPDAAATNSTASASVSQASSSDAVAVDAATSVVPAGVFQTAPCFPATRSVTHPDPISTADTRTSSEGPASSAATAAPDGVDASSFPETEVPVDPVPSTPPAAASPRVDAASPAHANVTGPVSSDSTRSVSPSPSAHPGLHAPADTTHTSGPTSSASGVPDATRPSVTSTAVPAAHSEMSGSVHLPASDSQGAATTLGSISTSEDTEVPSVTMATAASPPDSAGPTRDSRAEVNEVQTPPEEKPRCDAAINEKATDDEADGNAQRGKQDESNGDCQGDGGNEQPDAEGEIDPRVSAAGRDASKGSEDGAVGRDPRPETAPFQGEDQQNGTQGRPGAEPQLDETSSVLEK